MSLLAGAAYEPRAGEFGLLNPIPQAADDSIARSCEAFLNASPAQRDLTRETVTERDYYSLLAFGDRSAVFAMREKDPRHLRRGLAAIALLKYGQYDFRDFHFGELPAAAAFLELDVPKLMSDAAALAEPKTAGYLGHFNAAMESAKKRRIRTKLGVGFLPLFSEVAPGILELLPAGVEAAETVERSGRYIAAVEGQYRIPDFWYRNENASGLVARTLGAVQVRGRLAATVSVEMHPAARSLTWLGCGSPDVGMLKPPRSWPPWPARQRRKDRASPGLR